MHKGHYVRHRSSQVTVVNKVQHTADRAHRPIHRRVVGERTDEQRCVQQRAPANFECHAASYQTRFARRRNVYRWPPFPISQFNNSYTSRCDTILFKYARHVGDSFATDSVSRATEYADTRRYANTRLVREAENDRKTEWLPDTSRTSTGDSRTCHVPLIPSVHLHLLYAYRASMSFQFRFLPAKTFRGFPTPQIMQKRKMHLNAFRIFEDKKLENYFLCNQHEEYSPVAKIAQNRLSI